MRVPTAVILHAHRLTQVDFEAPIEQEVKAPSHELSLGVVHAATLKYVLALANGNVVTHTVNTA